MGIGNIDIAELRLISSDPDNEHVFILSSFRDAAGFVDFLSVTTCESEFNFTYFAKYSFYLMDLVSDRQRAYCSCVVICQQ